MRKNLDHLSRHAADYILILSGDQLYRMDIREMLRFALETDADAVVAAMSIAGDRRQTDGNPAGRFKLFYP